ncbi:hypothetical protein ACLOJK_038350 [Asimina triloba]
MAPGLRPWLNIFKELRTVAEWNFNATIIPETAIDNNIGYTEDYLLLFATCRALMCESVRFVAVKKEKKRAPKRPRPLEEGSNLVGSDSFTEDVSKLSPLGGTSLAADSGDRRRVVLTQESIARSGLEETDLLSDMSWLREELEAS